MQKANPRWKGDAHDDHARHHHDVESPGALLKPRGEGSLFEIDYQGPSVVVIWKVNPDINRRALPGVAA